MAVAHSILIIGYAMLKDRPQLLRAWRQLPGADQQGPTPTLFPLNDCKGSGLLSPWSNSLNNYRRTCERPTPCCGSSSHRVCACRVPLLGGRRWVERRLCGAIRRGSRQRFRGGQEEHGSGIADIHRSCSPRPQNGSVKSSAQDVHSRAIWARNSWSCRRYFQLRNGRGLAHASSACPSQTQKNE